MSVLNLYIFDISFYPLTLSIDTLEENYRAFKLFSIMDIDHSGTISLREINRMLLGDMSATFLINFDHPDTGIVWGIDVEGKDMKVY